MKFATIAQSLTAFAVVKASVAIFLAPNDVFAALRVDELQDGDDDIMDNPCFDKSIEAYMCGIDAGVDNSSMETCGNCIMTGINDPESATCKDFNCSAISECVTKNCGPCEDELDDLFSCLLTEGGCPACIEEGKAVDIGAAEFFDKGWSCQDGSSCKSDRDCESGECIFYGKKCLNGRQCSCPDDRPQICWTTCSDGSKCTYRNGLGYQAVEN